jgi:hypothetical protein
MFVQNRQIFVLIAGGALCVGLATSCAPDYEIRDSLGAYSNAPINQVSPLPPGSPGGPPVSPPNPSPTPDPTPPPPSDLPPPFQKSIRIQGYTGTQTISVQTTEKLVVRFTPALSERVSTTQGFVPAYSKAGLAIEVNGVEKWTALLANGMHSPAQSSTLTFSSSDLCPGTGSCTVQIKFKKPNNDFYCLNYGTYCPNNKLYTTHWLNGTVEIQTDFTSEMSAI